MKIGIDARFLTHPQLGGFKTYSENLISALARVDSKNEYFLYLDRQPDPLNLVPSHSNFSYRAVPYWFPLIGMPWREQIALARQVNKDQVDLFHSPCLTAPLNLHSPLVVTVHDMIWASHKNFISKGSWSVKRKLIDWYNYLIPRYVVRKASVIITVSNTAKENIQKSLNLNPDQVVVTHEAAGSAYKLVRNMAHIETVRSKYNLPSNYILALGAADPRKNIKGLIRAYGVIPVEMQEKYHLLIVWPNSFLINEMSKQVNDLGLHDRVRFLWQVPIADLVIIYNAASLFAFPSLQEGFGLPLLEAMTCGVPVVASNTSSIPEIVGDAALLFNPEDTNQMASVITRILMDDALRASLRKKGSKRATAFSWDKCARETIDVYEAISRSTKNQRMTENL